MLLAQPRSAMNAEPNTKPFHFSAIAFVLVFLVRAVRKRRSKNDDSNRNYIRVGSEFQIDGKGFTYVPSKAEFHRREATPLLHCFVSCVMWRAG